MPDRRFPLFAAALVMLSAVLLAGCPPRLKISEINRDPGRHINKEVTVAGRVSSSMGVFGTGLFQIDDGSGTIWVYSQSFGVPSDGAKVAVVGRIEQGVSLGGRHFATLLRETRPRR